MRGTRHAVPHTRDGTNVTVCSELDPRERAGGAAVTGAGTAGPLAPSVKRSTSSPRAPSTTYTMSVEEGWKYAANAVEPGGRKKPRWYTLAGFAVLRKRTPWLYHAIATSPSER